MSFHFIAGWLRIEQKNDKRKGNGGSWYSNVLCTWNPAAEWRVFPENRHVGFGDDPLSNAVWEDVVPRRQSLHWLAKTAAHVTLNHRGFLHRVWSDGLWRVQNCVAWTALLWWECADGLPGAFSPTFRGQYFGGLIKHERFRRTSFDCEESWDQCWRKGRERHWMWGGWRSCIKNWSKRSSRNRAWGILKQ